MKSLNSETLPTDWEMKYDFATKRQFFVNHKTKVTTWEDPRKPIKNERNSNFNVIDRKDFIEDDADMDKVIKMIEKENEIAKDLKIFSDNYPEFDRNYIKNLLIKSKGNASTVEVILRQERRKETSSIISYSTIDSGVSGSKSKLCEGEKTRFSLSERYRYDAPESSKDRIKSKLRSEFKNVDNRIVDRVLQVTDYSLEDSRNILLTKNKSIEETIKDKEINKREKQDLDYLKNVVSQRSSNMPQNLISATRPNINKRIMAAGPDPKNHSGAQLNKNKFK